MEIKFKPFDLEAAKNGAPVVTRDGQPVRIICFDRDGDYPIVALVKEGALGDVLLCGTIDGKCLSSSHDLFIASSQHRAFVNIYKGHKYHTGYLYENYDDAVNSGEYSELGWIRVATVPVEWEDCD